MLGKYIKKTLWRYAVGGTALLLSVLFDIWYPMITLSIVDDVIVGGNMDRLWFYLTCILIVGLGRAVSQYVKELLCDMAGCNVAESLRKDLMGHIQKLSKSFFDRSNTGELMARVKDDTGKVWDITGFAGMLAVEGVCYFVGVVICMLRLNWKLSLIPLAFMPILGIYVMSLGKKLGRIYDDMSEANASLTRTAEENISGVRTVKAFATEQQEIDKFREKNLRYYDLNCEEALFMAKAEPIINLIPKLMQSILVGVGGYAAIQGHITYGVLVAFLQYASNIVWPIENMGWILNLLSSGVASCKKIKKIFNEQPEIRDKEDAICDTDGRGELAFEHVSFSIGDKPILEDISFTMPKGKTLGIMGATGSGKSTLVSLVGRFYDATEGRITIDGVDVKDLTLGKVRSFSSVVTQEVFLFSDSIEENVKLGQKDTMDETTVESAIENACAMEFVSRLSQKSRSVIGERGIGLSGGQKQRLSIARALAKKADLLILDDATSALDMETEEEVQKVLEQQKGLSKMIIGHRISSVRNADEILVLKDGRILERGNHEQLLAQKGYYYATYEAQYGDYHRALNPGTEGVIL